MNTRITSEEKPIRGISRTMAGLGVVLLAAVSFLALSQTRTPGADHAAPAAASTTASPQPPEDSVVPISPCRLVDTRNAGAGGPLKPSTVREFRVVGSSGFQFQGGHDGGCGIPRGTPAVVVTVTAIDPASDGYIRAWPAGRGEPNASVLQFTARQSNAGTATVLLTAGVLNMSVISRSATSTNITIDVTAFATLQLQTVIGPNGEILVNNGTVVSGLRHGDGTYVVTFNRDLVGCTAVVNAGTGNQTATATVRGSTVSIQLHDAYNAAIPPSALTGTTSVIVMC